jgi:hypothetical protein
MEERLEAARSRTREAELAYNSLLSGLFTG